MSKSLKIIPLDGNATPPLEMPERFRLEVVYFMSPEDSQNAPKLGPNEYWIEPQNVDRWLDDGCFSVVSLVEAESVDAFELSEVPDRLLDRLQKFPITKVQIFMSSIPALPA